MQNIARIDSICVNNRMRMNKCLCVDVLNSVQCACAHCSLICFVNIHPMSTVTTGETTNRFLEPRDLFTLEHLYITVE